MESKRGFHELGEQGKQWCDGDAEVFSCSVYSVLFKPSKYLKLSGSHITSVILDTEKDPL